jgi:hypothetical protein
MHEHQDAQSTRLRDKDLRGSRRDEAVEEDDGVVRDALDHTGQSHE